MVVAFGFCLLTDEEGGKSWPGNEETAQCPYIKSKKKPDQTMMMTTKKAAVCPCPPPPPPLALTEQLNWILCSALVMHNNKEWKGMMMTINKK